MTTAGDIGATSTNDGEKGTEPMVKYGEFRRSKKPNKKFKEYINNITEASKMNPISFLKKEGYKLKKEKYNDYSFEIEFYSDSDCTKAYKKLVDKGFLEYYSMTSAGKLIGFEDL